MKKMENKKIPEDIDYDAITSWLQKLDKIKRGSTAISCSSSRISGVNPADVSIFLVYLEQGKIARVSQ